MDTQYDAEQWATETTRGRHVFNHNYRMSDGELRGWDLRKQVAMQQGPASARGPAGAVRDRAGQELEETVYLWEGKGGAGLEVVRISIAELSDWRQAQQQLQVELGQSMRPDIPRGTGQLAGIGDVSFAARDPESDVPASIAFVRGNVCVTVRSVGKRNIDVSAIATSVDRALASAPTRAARAAGRASELTPTPVKPEEKTVVVKDLRRGDDRGEWLKIIAPDGELRREGHALIYVSPEGGEKMIDIQRSR